MKYKKYIIGLIVAIIIGLGGRYIVNYSTLFVDTNTTVPANFLPINDYVLRDSHTKKPTQSIKGFTFEDQYDFYDYDNGLETSKGINTHSSFEEFVKSYGDYVADYISCYKVDDGYKDYDNDYEDDDYDDSIYLSNITINAFYNDYILTDKCNLDDYNITINFSCCTKLNKVYYTQKEKSDAYNKENIFWKIRVNEFNLYFSYECKNYEYNEEGKGIFDYISSSKWDY